MGFNGFDLDEDLKAVRNLIRDFTDREIRPLAEQFDQENLYIPEELWRKMGRLGLFGFTIPEEFGGNHLGYLALAVAIEEVSKGAGVMYSPVAGQNGAFNGAIIDSGTPEQKQKYLPGTAEGRLKGAFALTEPNVGSDARGMQTVAALEGECWIINGQKTFITNADRADYIITFAKTEEGTVCLIVDKDAKGLSIGATERKMGIHGVGLNNVFYTDCRVPVENQIGKVGEGFLNAKDSLMGARLGVAAGALGLAQEAIDVAVEYAKQRVQFGRPISQFQNTQFVLAECQTKLDAARLLTYRCAAALDAGKHETYMASMAKYYATETANQVADKCLQVFGGYGYCAGYPIERIYRDLRIFTIFDGTSEVHKMIISKKMGVR